MDRIENEEGTRTKCPVCYGDGCKYCNYRGTIDSRTTVWGYLQDAPLKKHYFPANQFNTFWGLFMEKLGRRTLKDELSKKFYEGLFPGAEIISSEKFGSNAATGRIFERKKGINVTVDLLVLLHGMRDGVGEKNAVLWEIKSFVSPIHADHIKRWKDYLDNPSKYIKKCRAARLFVMWIYGLDYESRNIFYTIKEFIPAEIPNNFPGGQEQ